MDDIDTRLEAERPEVAGVLRSMNWEERLEQARARRQAVLDRNVADDKRPVVRIIDAAAVARKRADTQPVGPARPQPPQVAQADVAPEPEAASRPCPTLRRRTPRPGEVVDGRAHGDRLRARARHRRQSRRRGVPHRGPAGVADRSGGDGCRGRARASLEARTAPAVTADAASAPQRRHLDLRRAWRQPCPGPRASGGGTVGAAPLPAAVAPGPAGRPVPAGPAAFARRGPADGRHAGASRSWPHRPRASGHWRSWRAPVPAAFAPRPAGRPRPQDRGLSPRRSPGGGRVPRTSRSRTHRPRARCPGSHGRGRGGSAALAAAPRSFAPTGASQCRTRAEMPAPFFETTSAGRPAAGVAPAAPLGAAPAGADVLVPSGRPSPILAALPVAPLAVEPPDGLPRPPSPARAASSRA
jgi:hypothetical protein